LANDTDGDGDDLTATLLTSVSNGTLTFSDDGSFSYTPAADFHGTDSFTYTVTDETDLTATATVTIYVNSQAAAAADTYTAIEDTTLTIDADSGVLANDTDADSADTLTAVLVTDVSNGTLTLSADGSFVYLPDADFHGTDSFTYKANDGYENSAEVTVTITVSAVNDTPVATDDSYSTALDTTLTVDAASGLLANDSDVDGDGLAVTLADSPSHGTLSLQSNGAFAYTPEDGYQGTDTFTYTTTDGSLTSAEATVTIAVNNGVFAYADDYEVNEDQTLTVDASLGVLANDSDTDGDDMTVTLVTTTSHGTLSLSVNGAFTYTPNANYNGIDTFVYTASDGLSESAETTVTITVVAQADAPTVANDSYRTPVGMELAVDADSGVLANDADADGETLTPTIVSAPSNGTVVLSSDGSFTYTPNEGFQGTDTFTYTVTDGSEVSGTATVTIEVNALPTAANDSYAVDEDGTLTVAVATGVLANDSDADGDELTATLVTDATYGTLTLNADGSFSYTPDADFYGTDSFTYTVNDGLANSAAVGTATITVNQVSELEVSLELVDEEGASLTTAAVGDTVVLNIYVQDIRVEATGVQKAALDLIYDAELLTFAGYTYGDSFVSSVTPDTSTTAGTVDELWAATDGSEPSGSNRVLLCSITFTVTASGTADFTSEMAESYDTALTDATSTALTAAQIKFNSAALEITSAVGALTSAADAALADTDDWLI
jgi:VCBS repeat-containing protein